MDELERYAAELAGKLDQQITETFYANTVAPEPLAMDVRKTIQQWELAIRNFRREQITFVVDLSHQGPPIRHKTPNDGECIELSYVQANEVHQSWPLKMHKIINENCAEFVPVSVSFPDYAEKYLPAPPYEVPEEETFDEWMNAHPRLRPDRDE